jgi:(p)ppGpp synthase/HD superfamily hydrolase
VKFTPRLEKAICAAAMAHRKQQRKGSELPFIIHPFGVMSIASQVTNDEDILIACLFHDVLEDVPEMYPAESMRDEFGDKVLRLVKDVTYDLTIKDWQKRSEDYLYHLENRAHIDAVIICAADKTHNLMSIIKDSNTIGDTLWGRFSSDKQSQLWWYRSSAEVIEKRIPDLELLPRLRTMINQLEMIVNN